MLFSVLLLLLLFILVRFVWFFRYVFAKFCSSCVWVSSCLQLGLRSLQCTHTHRYICMIWLLVNLCCKLAAFGWISFFLFWYILPVADGLLCYFIPRSYSRVLTLFFFNRLVYGFEAASFFCLCPQSFLVHTLNRAHTNKRTKLSSHEIISNTLTNEKFLPNFCFI